MRFIKKKLDNSKELMLMRNTETKFLLKLLKKESNTAKFIIKSHIYFDLVLILFV